MESNEITMFMDVKIDKRPECVRYSQWCRSQVKIEAVKCLPCFLRITLMDDSSNETSQGKHASHLILCINVPGVSITLASSRTKMHSYALCWTQNRKNCFLYFALDSELSCRRHMKWVRKSIKNLELHRKLLLDERRCGGGGGGGGSAAGALIPHLKLDDFKEDNGWSQRVSEIYEEIYEPHESRRGVSRRCSRTSIASGIYEEMILPNDFDIISEEMPTTPVPPPLPPLPPQRKRFNTFETEEVPSSPIAETPIPRCSTNPETELAKKKKYKNMLDNIFHGNGLRKRTVSSNSEGNQAHLASGGNDTPKRTNSPIKSKAKEAPAKLNQDDNSAAKRVRKPGFKMDFKQFKATQTKRNSFSSPDLSKINFIDTFDEQHIAELLNPSFLKGDDDLDLANFGASLDESQLLPAKDLAVQKDTSQNLGEQNISTQLPNNFNFSACNSSSINLIAPLSANQQKQRLEQALKNEILLDDLTGYCVMAPIVPKMSAIDNSPPTAIKANVRPLETASSGYSTGSYSSTASSTEVRKSDEVKELKSANDSVVYINMQNPEIHAIPHLLPDDFTGNLYENLLAIKAARELEPAEVLKPTNGLSTSTPTESPLMHEILNVDTINNATTPTSTKIIITTVAAEAAMQQTEFLEEEENFYQTPRKSIISIDEKIPSYYPNTYEISNKSRRRSYSPAKVHTKYLSNETTTPTSSNGAKQTNASTTASSCSSNSNGLRQLVSSKLRRERKENLYLTSPQCIMAQRKSTLTANSAAITKAAKTKKTAAHKISENVYAVKHRLKKTVAATTDSHSNNNNNNADDVLEHLSILQNIDFKFEDNEEKSTATTHHLQVNQSANTCHYKNNLRACSVGNSPGVVKPNLLSMTQSIDAATAAQPPSLASPTSSPTTTTIAGVKKFASLPRFKKFDLSPLRMRINNVLQRNQQQQQQQHVPEL